MLYRTKTSPSGPFAIMAGHHSAASNAATANKTSAQIVLNGQVGSRPPDLQTPCYCSKRTKKYVLEYRKCNFETLSFVKNCIRICYNDSGTGNHYLTHSYTKPLTDLNNKIRFIEKHQSGTIRFDCKLYEAFALVFM